MLATNANLTVPDYLRTGEWQPRPSLATLASAMDVGNPSNMERLRWLFGDVEGLREQFSAHPVGDDDIRATIRRDHGELGTDLVPAHGHGRARLSQPAARSGARSAGCWSRRRTRPSSTTSSSR